MRGRQNLRQHARRDVQPVHNDRIVFERVDVIEHGARRVAVIGDVRAGQIPDQPCIDRAEQEIAGFGKHLSVRNGVQDVAKLRCGKIRVDEKPRRLRDVVPHALADQLLAQRRGAAALPHDRRMHGLARRLFPDDRRFALVRDPDRSDLTGLDVRLFQDLTDRVELGL